MASEFNLILLISMILIIVILSGVLLSVLFKQATKDRAYIRTGYGGEVIAQNRGIFIIPLLHHAIPVNLKTMGLKIELGGESAVLTKDHMKADLSIIFYVQVKSDKESISQVAGTLGDLTLSPEKLKDFLSGQLVHTIRKVSAEIAMADIHQQTDTFVEKIQQAITNDLNSNSLRLDFVTLERFEPSSIEFYSENNVFDTEGLSQLSKIIQSEKQVRYELERQSLLQSKQKDLEMETLLIEMENKKNQLRLDQQRELKIFEAANDLTISQDAIKKNTEETQTQILADQELEIFQHQSEILLGEKLREKLKQQIETDLVKAEAVKAKVRVKLTRKLEKADNLVKIKLLDEQRKNEHEATKTVQLATARKHAAVEDADALRIIAEGEANKLIIIENHKLEAEKLIELGLKNRYKNEAEGIQTLIKAFNSLPKSDLPRETYPKLIELFSKLCLENNELMRQSSYIKRHIDNSNKAAAALAKQKPTDSKKSKTKLQAILDDARVSLTEEAINTINGSGLKQSEQLRKENA